MKGQDKILQLSSNLSKLIDSLCFQLSVNIADESSLSLIEILEWKNNGEISQQEFKQLYCGWLESKNIFDLFTVRQLQTYPKEQLLEFQGPIQKILTINQITKTLQMLNNLYNEIYMQNRVKGLSSSNPKNQIKNIEEAEKLFSFLDSSGIINLRLSELFFLSASISISQNKAIPIDFEQFKGPLRKTLGQMSQIKGCVSLRNFKNYFLIQKNNPLLVKNLNAILIQIQNQSKLTNEVKSKNNSLPNIFQQSIQKWKSFPRFKSKQNRVQFFRRIFQENQKLLMFGDSLQNQTILGSLIKIYGKDLLNCLQIDQIVLEQFIQILQDTLNKYLLLFQKVSSIFNKNKAQNTNIVSQSSHLISQNSHYVTKNSQYINQDNHHLNQEGQSYSQSQNLHNSTNKKKFSNIELQSGNKIISRTSVKQRTPQKKRRSNHEFTASNSYRNRTPRHKNTSQLSAVHREFGSAQKKANVSGRGARQTTPTKQTLSFMTEMPRKYRAAQKRGLNQNHFYDKLFFFRNKRVESYQIVMKRLKNK